MSDEVTARDIVRGVMEGEAPFPERATEAILDSLDHAGFAVVARVWVAQLDLVDGQGGWIGVHVTAEGAAAALVEWAQGVGIAIDGFDYATGSEVLDGHPDVESYGVSFVEVKR